MNLMKTLFLVACLVAATCASSNAGVRRHRSNAVSNSHRPSEWLTATELENLPALDEVSFEDLLKKSPEEGADMVNKIYHTAQTSQNMNPSYAPNANEITVSVPQPNGQKSQFPLNQFVAKVKEMQPQFGNDEVTIFLTGLPKDIRSVKKANQKLVQAYMQRYASNQQQKQQQQQQQQQQQWRAQQSQENGNDYSDEDYAQMSERANRQAGNLVVVELGEKFDTFERIALLDIEKTGAIIANMLVQLTENANVPQDIVNIVGQGISAQVAGAACREYTRQTGKKLRRITGLDPWKMYARHANTLNGLARGDADFVDVIHTTAYGLGTPARCGNIDFYPNGPSVTVPGVDDIIEGSMRATRYYAESIWRGNQKNFPAVAATSLQKFYSRNGYGKRVYMGIDTDFDLEGDYVLPVNPTSPFGQYVSPRNQNNYMRTKSNQPMPRN